MICGKIRNVPPSQAKVQKFCSRMCKGESQKGFIPWNKGLTKEEDVRLQSISKKSREQMFREYQNGTRNRFDITQKANETLRNKTIRRLEANNPNRRTSGRGYRMVYLPRVGWCSEHRWIWEKHNGCKVPVGFHIHHKNGDKIDNRIENLELISASEHRKLHYKDRTIDTSGKLI